MESKFRFAGEFIDRVDVVCPKCTKKALVAYLQSQNENAKFSCFHCGSSEYWKDPKTTTTPYSSKHSIKMGAMDPFFGYQLWYTVQFRGESLYAYNLNHLNFLEEYIFSKNRQRQKDENGWSNRSLQSRLPKWMLSNENRSILIKKIQALKIK